MPESVLKSAESRMDKSINSLRQELGKIRTGRASLSLLDGIKVDYYGNLTPLNQVATLGVPESRLITVQPWEPQLIGDIERAILKSDLGLTPVNDGKILRIPIPQLTEERRKELVKVAKRMDEECKVSIRNIRRDCNEQIKSLEKDKAISKDNLHKYQKKIQDVTDAFIKKADEVLANKEKEIMEI